MHPIRNIVSEKCEDLTPQLKKELSAIKIGAAIAMALADCECPFAAEGQILSLTTHLRKATQIVKTASDYYERAEPVAPWKKEQIEQCRALQRELKGETDDADDS